VNLVTAEGPDAGVVFASVTVISFLPVEFVVRGIIVSQLIYSLNFRDLFATRMH
jgi:hypothetical protein